MRSTQKQGQLLKYPAIQNAYGNIIFDIFYYYDTVGGSRKAPKWFSSWLRPQVQRNGNTRYGTPWWKGWATEVLKGPLKGFFSARLDRKWRIIFEVEGRIRVVAVLSVTPHLYARIRR